MTCEWCDTPDATEAERPETLCVWHAAEYEGTTVDRLEREDRLRLSLNEYRRHESADDFCTIVGCEICP